MRGDTFLRTTALLGVMLFAVSTMMAQNTWVRVMGGSLMDQGYAIAATSNGGCVITGMTRSSDDDFAGMGHGGADILVASFDAVGNLRWKRLIGGSEADRCNAVITTADGGIVVAGATRSSDGDFDGMNRGQSDIVVMRLDSNGAVQWKYTYGGTAREGANAIAQTTDGGFVVTGSSSSNDGDFTDKNKDSADIFVMKLNPKGSVTWITTFGGSVDESGYGLAATTDGGCVVAGYTYGNERDFLGKGRGSNDVFVIKLDAQGRDEWINTYGGSKWDVGSSITQTLDGGYAITGHTHSEALDLWENRGDWDNFVIKLDSKGLVQWQKTIGGSRDEDSYAILSEPDGGLILTGYTNSKDGDFEGLNRGGWDIFVMKLNATGSVVWKYTYGGGGSEGPNAMVRTTDGYYAITGTLIGSSPSYDGDFRGMNKGGYDVIVMKIGADGVLERKK